MNFLSSGLVQSRSSVRPGRVLRSVRRSRLPPSPQLPEGSDGLLRGQRAGRPHAAALQLRLLRLPRPRKQVLVKVSPWNHRGAYDNDSWSPSTRCVSHSNPANENYFYFYGWEASEGFGPYHSAQWLLQCRGLWWRRYLDPLLN